MLFQELLEINLFSRIYERKYNGSATGTLTIASKLLFLKH